MLLYKLLIKWYGFWINKLITIFQIILYLKTDTFLKFPNSSLILIGMNALHWWGGAPAFFNRMGHGFYAVVNAVILFTMSKLMRQAVIEQIFGVKIDNKVNNVITVKPTFEMKW